MKSMKFAKRTKQEDSESEEIVITDVAFLQKANFEQRKEIQQRKATMERQKTIIKYLKAELKELKAKKAMKAMKNAK